MTTVSGGPRTKRPRPFAEDWTAPETLHPPLTVSNPLRGARPSAVELAPRSVGDHFRRLTAENLGGVPNVDVYWGGLDLARDGSEVAFSWDRTGAFEVYTAPLEGDRIIQLTASGMRSVMPRWSPDGRWVAFLRDEGGDESFQIWLVDRDGVRERRLTGVQGVKHQGIEWSPDGTRLAYAANPAGRAFALHTIDARNGDVVRLTSGPEDDHQPRWSPDGRWIAFWSRRDRVRTNSDLYLISALGGEPVRLETRDGKPGESLDPQWSPDGTAIAFTTNVRGRYEIAMAQLRAVDDGPPTIARIDHLGTTPFDDREPCWRPDGRAVLYLHDREAEVSVRRVFTISRADDPLGDVPGVFYSPRAIPESEGIVAIHSGARRPPDVVARSADGVYLRPITASLPPTIDPETLVEPIHIRYPGADDVEIPALLYLPHREALHGTGAPPAIVYVHGGPTAQHFRRWDPVPQLFANHGYVVLAPNIRGSTGYGRGFQEANRRDWGGRDLADVVRGAKWIEREGIADRDRIGIRGASYGGFTTLLAMAMSPARFAAGVALVGVVNWTTMYETTRGDLRHYLLREFGDPTLDAGLYRERSPLTHAAKIRSPLLVLQGANDPRVPLAEAEQMVEALRANGVPHEYHVYADEGHVIAKRENKIDALRRSLEWFDRHLMGGEARSAVGPSAAGSLSDVRD